MSVQDPIKLHPRNVSALRRGQDQQSATRLVTGNPVSTRLESGVGNCFPGLECDLRNLERRFFPFLEVDIFDSNNALASIVSVDTVGIQAAANAGQISTDLQNNYQLIADDLAKNRTWLIVQISGEFGPLGQLSLTSSDLGLPSVGANRHPPDAWTAVRLLTEGTAVHLTISRETPSLTLNLSGNRARYLDDHGALAKMFLPGELTQSLCSPWTHDFRDCGCFYWASNHPDIAKPPLSSTTPNVPEIHLDVPWERANRNLNTLPEPATINRPNEMRHYEINSQWQALNFVLEGREIIDTYHVDGFKAKPFADPQELEANLRYAAGVELAVLQEYLTAAFSLRRTGLPQALRDDVTAAYAELIRIAIGEMRHLRAANDVLASLRVTVPFEPALRVALEIPTAQVDVFRPVQARAAQPNVIQDFIDLERPSLGVDGLYARILATLEQIGTDEQEQTIRSIMAEGEDHFETFSFIHEWLDRHAPNDYLLSSSLTVPPANNAVHQALQQKYLALLGHLYEGYRQGLPGGVIEINTARNAMIGPTGMEGAAEAVAAAGFLVAFDKIDNNPKFAPLARP